MSKIKPMKPVVLIFKKADGEMVELPLEKPEKPFSEAMKDLVGDFPKVTIGYDCIPFRFGRVLKNVRVQKRRMPILYGSEGEKLEEPVYDIYWESEEPFNLSDEEE